MLRTVVALLGVLLSVSPTSAQTDRPIGRILFGSCASQERPQPIWDAVLALNPELFLFLGDNIYADTDSMEIMRSKYKQFAAVPGFQKLMKSAHVMAVWDDHDYGADDAGAEYRMKDESQKLFLDFFQEPPDSPRWKRKGIYYAKVFGPPGKRVQVILLDTRFFRSQPKKNGRDYAPNTDPAATILGDEQWKWLEEQLRKPAEVRLLGSSIQVVAEDHPFEKWANFPAERARLYKLMADTKAGAVIFLSGDRHLAELSEMDGKVGYPLFDLTSSGLNQGARRWRATEKNVHRVGTMTHGDNFGAVLIDWDKPDPLIRLQIRDTLGDIVIQQKLDLSVLRPAEPTVAKGPANAKPVGPGAVTPAEAAKRLNEKLTVEFGVHSTGAARDKSRVFLNTADFRDRDNFTVVIDMKRAAAGLAAAGVADPQAYYKGKTVRVTGTVSVYNDKPQIIVEGPGQILVVEK